MGWLGASGRLRVRVCVAGLPPVWIAGRLGIGVSGYPTLAAWVSECLDVWASGLWAFGCLTLALVSGNLFYFLFTLLSAFLL